MKICLCRQVSRICQWWRADGGLTQDLPVNSLVFVFSCSRWFIGVGTLGAVMVSSRDGMFPWEGAALQHVADLETDERLYFFCESESHVAVVGVDETG